ncbi:unnamed protein product [Caretta caretta]
MLTVDLTANEKPVEVFKERKSYMSKGREFSDCIVYELVGSMCIFERPIIKAGYNEGLNERFDCEDEKNRMDLGDTEEEDMFGFGCLGHGRGLLA